MSFSKIISGLKKFAEIWKKTDNVELQRKLIELGEQVQKLQEEIEKLRKENAELKKNKDLSEKIVRHEDLYLTLKDSRFLYCTTCWDREKRLTQLNCIDGSFCCPICGAHGFYDRTLAEESANAIIDSTELVF